MIVYITTNLLNGKKYIGKDERNNPSYLGSDNLFKSAIKKYGRSNFHKEILGIANNKKELKELEKYYIKYYGAQNSDLFYNIAPGGDGGKLCINYGYREIPVLELDRHFNIIREYKSVKEAAVLNNLNYKILNSVCNKKRKHLKNRYFVFKKHYNRQKLMSESLPNRQRYITLSYKTGIFYFTVKELYQAEYPEFKTLSSFLNYTFKNKDKFRDKFITTRI